MYCGKCGKEVSKTHDFCINCGAKVVLNPNNQLPSDDKTSDHKKTNKLAKKRAIFGIMGVTIIILFVFIYLLFSYNSDFTNKIDGKYSDQFSGMIFIFDSENMTYESVLGSNKTLGTYEINERLISLAKEEKPIVENNYANFIIYNENYLIMDETRIEGEVPDGETFNASFKGSDFSHLFREDGTYEVGFYIGRKWISNLGTYKRSGDIIRSTLDINNNECVYVIYENAFYGPVFQKEY